MEPNNFDRIHDDMKEWDKKLDEKEEFSQLLSKNSITLLLIDHIVNIEINQNKIIEMLENNEDHWVLKQLPSLFIMLTAMLIASIALFKEPYGFIQIIFTMIFVAVALIGIALVERNKIIRKNSHKK
ncbi:hypothetical protein Mpet_0904 [Methanolacinia petrolearia DSM 11571]|uniref:Uncharacterized protein n=1 Tax=Methanolacinia petrolearia (strain DSM 11571 / OCM 486 / SEBR 4847) TaxID=679926 RepID=E1RJM5_METP4|nr:hypothetical protein [Methanolacinia petrolearia]ADN35672.1 hypothetical protein Mpet_0904 [Methanolacinia petrolearia DSM 11571]